ncbi:hypothetical protein [Oryza sativa Japonica Group]|uniref:Uncharacterized protein n=1 Tax=Oryza sativa subsp. japonica TaxID=39947 RepID=Q5ZCJ0_ORYSJ|nr:hypothetical protein [Oryza sativa Japonica Group]
MRHCKSHMCSVIKAPLLCGADRRGSTARRTHEEEKVEPVPVYRVGPPTAIVQEVKGVGFQGLGGVA